MNDEILSTEFERVEDLLIVHLSGELDLSNVNELQQQLEMTLQGAGRVMIDLTGLAYLDSQALRLIKQLANKAFKDGTKLQLVAPQGGFARQVLEMARMSDYVELLDSLD